MANNEAIQKAINGLKSQEAPNIRFTARKYNILESTLRRRSNGQTISHRDAL